MNRTMKSIAACMALMSLMLMHQATAQPNVNVDTHTGTGSVSIPIHSIQEGGFSVPISLGYSASGVRVTDVSGVVGMNWYLSAGGSISREVRGLPDDKATTGWLHNGVGTTIKNFVTTNAENILFQNLEALDASHDTDPDVFYINTPFVSGQFFFDHNGKIKLQGHQDIRIAYDSTSTSDITWFTITDAGGIQYIFDLSDTMSEAVDFDPAEVYFKRTQEQYGTAVSYRTNWHLTSIVLPNGSSIKLNYQTLSGNNFEAKKSWFTGAAKTYEFTGSASGAFGKKYILSSNYILKEILAPSGDRATFEIASRNDSITDNKLTGIQLYRRNDQLVKVYDLFYTRAIPTEISIEDPTNADLELLGRKFLTSIHQRSGSDVLPGYSFNYYGVDDIFTLLPESSSTATDFWGYYNGKESEGAMKCYVYDTTAAVLAKDSRYRMEPLHSEHDAKSAEKVVPGKDGTVNPKTIHYGSLRKVTYPTGGNTRLYYEPNEYMDEDSTYLGSGLRVYKTVTHDGVSHKNNITTSYNYHKADNDTITSGLIVERPKFAFGTPYRHDVNINSNQQTVTWVQAYTDSAGLANPSYYTIFTNFDLNGGANSGVRYAHVEVSQTGNGKVSYDYSLPAMIGDITANAGEWSPTTIQIARDTAGHVSGLTQSGFNVFPLSYNPNYDFERGLLEKTEVYDEQDSLISASLYEYTRIYTGSGADFVYGLDYDKLPTHLADSTPAANQTPDYFYVFGKYKLFANLANVLDKKIDRIYDPAGINKMIETVTDYTYSSTHKKVNKISTTNSDGTVQKQHLIYPQDYSITKPAKDDQVAVLDSMIARNILALPIEQYTTAQEVGESEKITSGSLTLFSDFSVGKVLPRKQYVLKTPQNTLVTSSVDNSGDSAVFSFDANYELISTIEGYDANDNPTTTVGRNQVYSGVHWGYDKTYPHATMANAKAEEVSYTGFETTTGHEMNFDVTQYPPDPYTAGRTGLQALSFATGSAKKLSVTLQKGNTDTYLLSLWISDPAAAGTLTATLKNLGLTTNYDTATISFTSDASWIYYEAAINVSDTSLNEFTVELVTDQTMTLDDILLYPENARVSYSSLGSKSEVLSATSPLGITQYLEYDGLLRNTLVRDDDKNIVSVNEYTDRQVAKPVNPYFHYKGSDCNGDAVFEYDEPDPTGYTYQWYFGEAPNLVPVTDTSGGTTITHDYSANDTYTVRLRATNNGKSADSYQTLEWDPGVKSVSICAAGPQRIDACTGAVHQVFDDGCYSPTGTQLAETIFTIGEIENCYDCTNLSYDWEVSQDSGSTWSDVGTSTSTSVSLGYLSTYQVRCKVTTSCASPETITSNTKTVVIYESFSTCPNEITY
ncbi:MAG: PKD domain-containing protein [Reichenbachiella sp.]|uniref:PKD domain-containing protein n=1 Tax=Reichenbachiella sp. TaxID=2184521 RepID=UPI003296BF31